MQNCVSYSSGEHIFRKFMKENGQGMCGGLVGPKTENVEKVLVLKLFWMANKGAATSSPFWGGEGVSRSKKWHFWFEMLCVYI